MSTAEIADASTMELPASTSLAIDRTSLAHERTLMAWVRTAVSLITFGFTIYKFFQYMIESRQFEPHQGLIGPRGFGLTMIGMGLFCLLLATMSHVRNMRALREKYTHVEYSLAALLAGVISLLGILAFIAVLFRQ